jgi:hypothetical protein
MLYRGGFDRYRDTLRFCLANNLGGYFQGYLCGHVWSELDGEIADFSCADWVEESADNAMYEFDQAKLGRIEWDTEPPAFVWQSARSLMTRWKPHGEPKLGDIWYSRWGSALPPPDYSRHNEVVEMAMPYIERFVQELKIRERITTFRQSFVLEDFAAAA